MANAMSLLVRKGREVRYQPYWEKQSRTTAVADRLFFTTIPASADLGNMQVAGQFPAPKQYRVLGFGIYTKITTPAVAGVNSLSIGMMLDTVFIFSIADKEYLRFTGWMAAGGGGVVSSGALSTDTWTQGGQALPYAWLKLATWVLIPMQQNFQVRQSNGAIVAAPNVSVDCTVVMHGLEERAIQ